LKHFPISVATTLLVPLQALSEKTETSAAARAAIAERRKVVVNFMLSNSGRVNTLGRIDLKAKAEVV
jgi:hypothetical protein